MKGRTEWGYPNREKDGQSIYDASWLGGPESLHDGKYVDTQGQSLDRFWHG